MSGVSSGPLYGAVDLGGTKILTAVAGADGIWLGEDTRPTEVDRGVDGVVARIADSVRASLRQAGGSRLEGLGVAAPGPIDVERGLILSAPNLPGWRDVPLAERLATAFGCPAVLENDANAAVLGEFCFGAGRGVRHIVYLTLSTGIGGGLILDGRLYRGASGSAGELGHIVLDESGPLCGCGAYGCLEALASGVAIAARGAEAVAAGLGEAIAREAAGEAVSAEHVAAAAAGGDPTAAAIISAAARYVGLALSDFVNIFNPDLIVLGGGLIAIGAPLIEPAVAVMRHRAFAGPAAHVRVVTAALGGRAGAAGALALVMPT